MNIVKMLLFILVGAALGGAIMFALFPLITHYLVGAIQGEDQMSLNATIFFVGLPSCTVVGAIIGGSLGRRQLRR